jgi:hypothetical protein
MTIITIATTTTAIEAGVTTTTQTITMMNAIVVTVGTTTGSMQTTVVGAGQSTEVVAGVQGADVEVTITVQRTGAAITTERLMQVHTDHGGGDGWT